MRLLARTAGLLALAGSVATCSEAATGTGAQGGALGARLAFAPSFSADALHAYDVLGSLGITLTQVRIALTASDGTVAHDTTIAFGVNQDTLRVELPVRIQGSEQSFTALVELQDASSLTLFAKTQTVTASVNRPPKPPVIVLDYVGPGHAARRLSLSPSLATLPAGSTTTLKAAAVDSAGGAVTDLLLSWTSSDATVATVSGSGATASVQGTGRSGTVTISATTPTGVTGAAQLVMTPLPTRVLVVAGNAQSGIVGLALAQPLVVRVTDDFGVPVAGVTVQWRAGVAGSSALSPATSVTAADGTAQTTATLGVTAGALSVTAVAGSASTTFDLTALAGAATQLVMVTEPPASILAGLVAPAPSVRVVDAYGNGVAGVPVSVAGTGLLANVLGGTLSATTDKSGLATFDKLTLTGTLLSGQLLFTTSSPALRVLSQTISLL